jgi:folate-binding protein YgfZ
MPKSTPEKEPQERLSPDAGFGSIRITGADRISFLQGQLTQDMEQLTPARPLYAGWASPKGRLLCLCWAVDWQDATWLLLPTGLTATIAQRLRMFVLRADVTIEESAVAIAAVTLQQPEITDVKLDKYPASYCFTEGNSRGNTLFLSATCDAKIGLQMALPDDHSPAPSLAGQQQDLLREWRLQNIRGGIPVVWPTTGNEFVPQMVNLDLLGGISFTKGCYVGQEIVARTQNLGRIKRRMYRFSAATGSAVAPGDKISIAGKPVGQVVDAIATDAQSTELLAVISIDQLAGPLHLDGADVAPLIRSELPYDIP